MPYIAANHPRRIHLKETQCKTSAFISRAALRISRMALNTPIRENFSRANRMGKTVSPASFISATILPAGHTTPTLNPSLISHFAKDKRCVQNAQSAADTKSILGSGSADGFKVLFEVVIAYLPHATIGKLKPSIIDTLNHCPRTDDVPILLLFC